MLFAACEITDNRLPVTPEEEGISVRLDEVAEILAMLPIHASQMGEVHDAVMSSSTNGYDEEYTMKHLFENPGAGVGENEVKSGRSYEYPLCGNDKSKECLIYFGTGENCQTTREVKTWMYLLIGKKKEEV